MRPRSRPNVSYFPQTLFEYRVQVRAQALGAKPTPALPGLLNLSYSHPRRVVLYPCLEVGNPLSGDNSNN